MKKFQLTAISALLVFCLSAQTFTSSNLPIVVINTNGQTIVDDPKIMADMGIIYNGVGVRNNVTDAFNHYNGKIGIEIRGQSSQSFPMKSYGFELWDNAGSSKNQSILGMPSESDWVLYAPYTDKTLMRNFLAYTMSREMGHWAANCRYVEVMLNNQYVGIYVLMEKVKRNSGRVSISKLNTTDISGDAVTGGYIFSLDKDAPAWVSQYLPENSTAGQSIRFCNVYPKSTAIVAEQASYIRMYVDSFETALNNNRYQDKQTGWRKYADENSFIDYFIVNEVSRNVDGYRLSTFLYKDRNSKGGKLVAGPVWDYDLAFRNANYCKGSDTTGWAYDFNKNCPQDYWQIPFWWEKLANDSSFQGKLRCRWKELRSTGVLSDVRLNQLIDSIVSLTAEARQRHFQKWPVLGQYVWPNPDPIAYSYSGEIDYLKEWLGYRLAWIGKNLKNIGGCYDYPASVKEAIMIQFYPNPFEDNITVNVKSRYNQALHLSVYDVSGRNVYEQSVSILSGSNYLTMPLIRLSPGIYFVKYSVPSGENGTMKMLKK